MTIGSLFSGIGGLELGLEMAGLGPTRWQVEIDPWCREVLAAHWPKAERFVDVREVEGSQLETVDVLCGGFPCQDVSSAGSRAGLAGSRSGLWAEYSRVVGELRPRWVVVENVGSGAHLWYDQVIRDLDRHGYDCLPVPLSASDVGAPHIRTRVFVLARDTHAKREPMVPCDAPLAWMRGVAAHLPGWAKPPSIRVANGVSRGMAAYGNAVVPRCAQVIGEMIWAIERGGNS